MAVALGGKTCVQSGINVTPLIDVLLVLLIIFMVISPIKPWGLQAQVPQQNRNPNPPPSRKIVIQVESGNVLRINQQIVAEEHLAARLAEIFNSRADKVCFLKADPSLEFREVANVIDIAKGAGVEQIGLLTSAPAHWLAPTTAKSLR